MENPSVSFVIPAYNADLFIQDCLDSIVNQTFQNWECIIVNDGSTDNTLSIIERMAELDSRFSYLTIPNSGFADVAREKGTTLVKSDWIVYLDADDYIDPDYLEKMILRAKETNADIVYCRMRLFNTKRPTVTIRTVPELNFNMNQVIAGKEALMLTIPKWKIGCAGALIKRSIWNSRLENEKIGDYSKVTLDVYNTRELLILSNKVAFADVNYHYRQHPNSNSLKMTIKPFYNTIVRDKMIEELIAKHFKNDSLQMTAIKQRRINNLVLRNYLLYKVGKQLPEEDRKTVKSIIKQYWFSLDKKELFIDNPSKKVLYTKSFAFFKLVTYLHYVASFVKSLILKKR
jgi:glycosyltransferase involved in cell wall biosynthesis